MATMLHLDQLRARIHGSVVTPDDATYDAARKVYNALIDKRPALLVRCVDVADVKAAVGRGDRSCRSRPCEEGLDHEVVQGLLRCAASRIRQAARTSIS
jgi:hypothetical protein